MKKLFTSLLLLGAVTVTQAQVTVTGYNETDSTVTINFTYDGARPTQGKVQDAIKTAFDGDPAQGVQPTIADLKGPQRKTKVKTIILTGDWNNTDISKNGGNNSIAKIVQEFSNGQNPSTLDISQCSGFVSKYVDVRDYYGASDPYNPNVTIPKTGYADGYDTERLETDFTSLPVYSAGGTQMVDVTSNVTVTSGSSEVTVKTVGHKDWAEGPEVSFSTNPDGSVVEGSWSALPDGAIAVVKTDNGYCLKFPDYTSNNPLLNVETVYTFVVDGNVLNVPADDVANLRSEDGKLWYDYTLYVYEDENGSVSTTSTSNPHQLQGDEVSGYTYTYQKSEVVEPVFPFSIDKELCLDGIIFPVSDNFTFIPNELFKDQTRLKKAVLSDKIEAIGNKAFGGATALETVNFPTSLVEMGYGAFKKTNISSANLAACTNLSRIRFETFQECFSLTKATFPTKIREIQKEAFQKCALDTVDLSQCHLLRRLAANCFENMKNKAGEYSLLYVTMCSHEKIIRGTSVKNNGDSNGAFHLCNNIKKVEIVGCENTCVTECICENRAFEWDITHYQTAAPSEIMEKVALLVFPEDLPVCENSPYSSSWDFFVGDYKTGKRITQENLLGYYRQVPNTGTGTGKQTFYDEEGNKTGEGDEYITCDYQIGNGWHEFIRVGRGEIIPKGEFLRTYSRTAGDGPCPLPNGITAYRAVDYKSTKVGWVKDKKNGTHYCTDPSKPEAQRVDADYVMITKDTDKSLYANGNRYSKLTIGGILYLRPLIAKLANLKVNNKTVPYDDEKFTEGDEFKKEDGTFMSHKEWYDSEAIYNGGQLSDVPGGHSYVPENTGVVLYSTYLTEESFLMLPGDEGTDIVYKEFRHTGDRFEQGRLNSGNKDDDINMLHGSYGDGWPVAPVYPWVYKNEEDCSGGHYTSNKEYRNFACVKLGTKGENKNGTVLERNLYGWQRLTPSKMKENRAFAQIPVNRFDNHNEGVDQMPDFTIHDVSDDYENYYSSTNEGTTFGPEEMVLLTIFEGESDGDAVVDGIKTVNTNTVNTTNDAWYTIQGVKVAQPAKGVYIHNGKKVVIK